ncbi:hypothetical protein TNCV_536391 [Trichonephila clavipes]|nr:hypothetical protein TNCV_536391 [Trichonephila clavipes]
MPCKSLPTPAIDNMKLGDNVWPSDILLSHDAVVAAGVSFPKLVVSCQSLRQGGLLHNRWRHHLSPTPQFRQGLERRENILQHPALVVSAATPHKTSEPTFFTSTYSVASDIEHRLSGVESDVLTTRISTAFPRCGSHLRFDIFELLETKLPVRLINTTNEWRLFQGHETTPLRVKGDIEDVCSELVTGSSHFLLKTPLGFFGVEKANFFQPNPDDKHVYAN